MRNLLNNHTFRTIASILIYTLLRFPVNFNWVKPPFPANFTRSLCDFQSNYSLPEASIHELYGTLIWSKIHHFFTNRQIHQFCTQNRFTSIWLIALMECALHTNPLYTFQRGQSDGVVCFFYKRKIRIAAICLGLQNALNISDNSSIYNYYGTNRVIIV